MRDEIDGRVLARYISGGSTPEEVEGIRAWAAADPARAEMLDSLVEVWRMTGRTPESWDVDHAWNRLVAARAPLPETVARDAGAVRALRPVELGPPRRRR